MRRKVWAFVIKKEENFRKLKKFLKCSEIKKYAYAIHVGDAINSDLHYHFVFEFKQPLNFLTMFDSLEISMLDLFRSVVEDRDLFNDYVNYLKKCHTEHEVLVINGKRM